MTGKHSTRESYPEYDPADPDALDEYYETTPLEARFDISTLQLLVVEAIPKHAAYGMMFEEYQKQRNRFAGFDTSEKKRLPFRLPAFHGRVAADLAILNDTSFYHFLVLIIELGLITFQYDFHNDYVDIRDGRKVIFTRLKDEENLSLYMQLEQHTIEMCSGTGAKAGKSKLFTPTVSEWLYNAISDVSTNMNMSVSDFVYICWCMGIQNALPESMIPSMVGRDVESITHRFGRSLKGFNFQIKSTIERMSLWLHNYRTT
jgi:hypothetical protein